MTPIDDREARQMLGPLAGEPSGTQWLDVERIVREGDRRRQNRTIGTGALAAVFLLTVAAGTTAIVVNGRQAQGEPTAGSASASPSADPAPSLPVAPTGPDCTLSAAPGASGLLSAVDHTGHYTVEEVSNGGKRTTIIRKDGVQVETVDIPNAHGGLYYINAKGDFTVTVGKSGAERPTVLSYAYAGGKLTKLKAAGATAGIADDGRIAGETSGLAPAIWERPDSTPRKLTVPQGKQARVVSFDQDGTLLGYARAEATGFANLWLPDGSSQAMPVAQDQDPPTVHAMANGWVIGFDSVDSFRYHVATKEYETLPAQILHPKAVAGNGTVVGGGTDGDLYVLGGDGRARKLAQRPGMQSYTVVGISDDGRTVTGNEYYPAPADDPMREEGRAVTWTCG